MRDLDRTGAAADTAQRIGAKREKAPRRVRQGASCLVKSGRQDGNRTFCSRSAAYERRYKPSPTSTYVNSGLSRCSLRTCSPAKVTGVLSRVDGLQHYEVQSRSVPLPASASHPLEDKSQSSYLAPNVCCALRTRPPECAEPFAIHAYRSPTSSLKTLQSSVAVTDD